MSHAKLNVLTLNCWGLKLPKPFCLLQKERFEAIGEYLIHGNYDLVLLQEVWSVHDYEVLCKKLFDVLPHGQYFHSGLIGSGMCVFSRHSILETLLHPYPISSSPFRVLHGDWYAQKSIGLLQIAVNGMRLNVYITHMQADYMNAPAEYRVYRLVQAFELAQFIRTTSDGCDGILVGGDLNTTPAEIGYNLVVAAANLQDCWISQSAERSEDIGATSDHPDNCFSANTSSGQRLDYLLYRNNSGCDMRCMSCDVTMKRVPGQDYDYSDHFGVSASLIIKKNITAMAPDIKLSCVRELYKAALMQLDDGVAACHNHRLHYALMAVLCLLTLAFISHLDVFWGLSGPLQLCRTLLMIGFGLCLWCAIVVSNKEENTILSAKKDIENQLRAIGNE